MAITKLKGVAGLPKLGTKWFKVQTTVLLQLQMALYDTRWWIRVLSSETICHFKNDSKKDLLILMNKFEQKSHKRTSQNRARQLVL